MQSEPPKPCSKRFALVDASINGATISSLAQHHRHCSVALAHVDADVCVCVGVAAF